MDISVIEPFRGGSVRRSRGGIGIRMGALIHRCGQFVVQRRRSALAAQAERFEHLIAGATDLVFELDSEDRFTFAFGKIGGAAVTPSRILGRTSREVVCSYGGDPARDPGFAAYRDRVAARSPFRDLEISIKRGDERCVLALSGKPIFDRDGMFQGYQVAARDVTVAALARDALTVAKEKAEAAAQARTAFLATMSHEIRNPLNGVIGLSRMLSEAPLDGEPRRLAAALSSSAEHLMQLINDILDLSRIEAEQFSLDEVPFDIRQTVREVVDLLRPQADAKNLVLDCTFAHDIPTQAVGDPLRLRQILLNLAGNALKFTATGRIAINVALDQLGMSGLVLAFSVRDTGPGIAPETITHLFKQFSQGSVAISRQYGGTGLGLAICSQLVRAMGGEIRVESRVGEGSVFRFTVRLRRAAESAKPAAVVKVSPAVNLRRPIRVLLAEDDTVNQLVAVNLLQKLGCRIEVVTNGHDAVEAATTEDYDVIVMDTVMPEMDGMSATRAIRSGNGPRNAVPIIAMTASASLDDRADCLAAGADEFIAKPMSLANLAAALGAAIGPRADAASDAPGDGVDIESVFANLGTAAGELIEVFSAETEARLTRMRRLRRTFDTPVLTREAHSLRSAAATFGCLRLSELAAALEDALVDGRAVNLDAAIDAMSGEFARARRLLETALAGTQQAA